MKIKERKRKEKTQKETKKKKYFESPLELSDIGIFEINIFRNISYLI